MRTDAQSERFWLEDPPALDLQHRVGVGGLIRRAAIEQRLRELQHASLIELRGGTGWGKTSAAIVFAADRQRAGVATVVIERGGAASLPARPQGDLLVVLDGVDLADGTAPELLQRVETDARLQVIICSRTAHDLAAHARSRGLVVPTLHVNDFRMTASELCALAEIRGLRFDRRRAEYAVHASGGWPIVITRFLDAYAEQRHDISITGIDELVTRSFTQVLHELFGADAPERLARAALNSHHPDSDAAESRERTEGSEALRTLRRARELGLGEWIAHER